MLKGHLRVPAWMFCRADGETAAQHTKGGPGPGAGVCLLEVAFSVQNCHGVGVERFGENRKSGKDHVAAIKGPGSPG